MILPGYVFVEVGSEVPPSQGMKAADWHRIRRLPGVIRILGEGRPEALSADEAERIRWLDHGGEAWCISTAEGSGGSEYLIKSGPLKDCKSEIQSIDRRGNRARIEVRVLGEKKSIDLALIFENAAGAAGDGENSLSQPAADSSLGEGA